MCLYRHGLYRKCYQCVYFQALTIYNLENTIWEFIPLIGLRTAISVSSNYFGNMASRAFTLQVMLFVLDTSSPLSQLYLCSLYQGQAAAYYTSQLGEIMLTHFFNHFISTMLSVGISTGPL